MKKLLPIIVAALASLQAHGQIDTLVTKLSEVVVVGVKSTDMADMEPVTTVSASTAQRLGIATMMGISEIAPNFYVPEYGSRMTSSIYMRGLGARMDQPVVGLNVDGVPYLNKDSYDFDLFDIQKVDLYRGAQSVLNGRNTMCGQVNILTLSPWQYQGLRVMAEYGRANSVKAGAGYYHRFSDAWASSLTAYYTMTDGFFTNEHNGQKVDHEKQGSLRWKLGWRPSSRLSLTNVASAQISRQGGYPYMSLATGKIAYNDTCFYCRNSFADGLTIGWSSKRVVVTSVTSLQYIDDNMTLDQDFTTAEYFTLTQKRKEWALTEDLYAKGRRGNLNWVGGVFGFVKNSNMKAPVTFKNDGIANLIEGRPNQMNPNYPIQWDQRRFVLGSDFETDTRGAALYGQAMYALGGWDFELGLRWDMEWVDLDYRSHCNTSYTTYHLLPDGSREVYRQTPVNIDDRGHLSKNFGELLPKIAVGYKFEDSGVRLYASASKGYKAGGFNSQMFSDVLQQRIMALMGISQNYDVDKIIGYGPEKSWNYELGVKAPLLSDKLNVDGCIFYIDCTDQQLTTFPDGLTTGRIMTNAGRTRSYGAEATIDYAPIDGLALRASYGYTNATFRKYDNGKVDLKGKRVPYAPSNTLFVSAVYNLPLEVAGVRPSVGAHLRGVGDICWDDENKVVQPFYATLGASVELEHKHWSLRLWGENITNTKFDTFYFVSIGNAFLQRGKPWTIGATLRLNFDFLN